EAADMQQPITRYAPKSAGSIDYRAFAGELLDARPDPAAAAATDDPRSGSWLRSLVGRAAGDPR
ncbi:MAG: hypothetical protein OEX05_08680, partial [Chloroflexota bacterium]|nr:hypothetical protein [Chloroflexota bacterium]